MLETDEVDVDYFTPAESTSLASIFGKDSQTDEAKSSATLKYVPPPQPSAKTEKAKPTKWIFTCVVQGFEWSGSGYINRGNLGLAILKVIKTNCHSIILYDSNKATVSFTTISSKLKIHIRDDLNLSYYDNSQKCWNIQISNDDMNNMLEVLKKLQVSIVTQSFNETDPEQSDSNKVDNKNSAALEDDEKELDTDSYVNQKTKDSILKRMANMGHSVLPTHDINKDQTSDSTGSDDVDASNKNIRHKPNKNNPKKIKDLSLPETEANIVCYSKKNPNKSHIDRHHFPLPIKSSLTDSGSDMNVFISEQRMCNSELRINVNRMADKIDLMLEKITDVATIDKNNLSSFQNEIVQKLMREYESKIKCYEDFMSSKGIDCHSINSQNTESIHDIEKSNKQIEELRKECIGKDEIITTMKDEIRILNEKNNEVNEKNSKEIEALLTKIQSVNHELKIKNDEILSYKNTHDIVNSPNAGSCDTSNKVKKIMNDTFQAISASFSDEDTYTGESLKTIIATVIKKTTIEALKEL